MLSSFLPASALAEKFAPEAGWEVFFSLNGGAAIAISRELNQARPSVLVQAYSFTSAPVAWALLRGVRVKDILDQSQQTEKYSAADFLINAGIKTFIDAVHAITHNKGKGSVSRELQPENEFSNSYQQTSTGHQPWTIDH